MSTLTTNKRRNKKAKKVEDIEFKTQVSENLNVTFTDLPRAVYSIEVPETAFFQRARRVVDLFQEQMVDNTCTIYLPLDRQETSCTSLFFPMTADNSEDFDPDMEEPQYFSDLEVRALLLQKERQSNLEEDEYSDDGEETEYEEEFYFDKKDNCFRCGLVPGKYMLIVKGEGLKEYNQVVQITQGNMNAEIQLQKPSKKQIIVWTHDATNGEPLAGVILKWRKKASKQVTEGLTAKEGVFCFVIEENGTYIIEAEKKGYINYHREIFKVKGNEKENNVRVTMLPVELPQSIKASEENKEGKLPQMTRFRMVYSLDSDEKLVYPHIFGKTEEKEGNNQSGDFEVDPSKPNYQDS